VLCGLTLIGACVVSSDLRRRLLDLRWIAGLALIVVLAAPWFAYMYVRFRHDFVNGYVLDENLRLFAASRFKNQPGPLFYVQILAAGFLPWTGLFIGRLVDDAVAAFRGEALDRVEILLCLWTFVIVAFFSASTFKLDHYVFPAAPAMCLLCARAWEDVRTAASARRNRWSRVGAFTIGPILVAVGAAIGILLLTRLALPVMTLIVPVALVMAGAAFTLVMWRRSTAADSVFVPWSAVAALGVTYAGIILFALPGLEPHKVAPDLARFVAGHADAADRIATYRLNRLTPAFRFYVNRHTEFLETPPEAEAFFGSGGRFCVMAHEAYDELTARGAPLAILYERNGMWVTSGRLLFRNRPAPTTFVVVAQAR
jgi:4-amino-4-deoxy-L-arabinose transferase-like glycosyltransferase